MATSEKSSSLFRKEALERLQNPERLDQMMQIINLPDWIPLAALASLTVAVVAWGIVGRIPVAVQGNAALIFPRTVAGAAQVAHFEAKGAGLLSDLRVMRGQRVTRGQLLAVVDLPELRKTLEAERERLAELREELDTTRPLKDRQLALAVGTSAAQRRDLELKLASARTLSSAEHSSRIAAMRKQRDGLEMRLRNSRTLARTLSQELETRRKLLAGGLISGTTVFETERAYLDATQQVAETELQLREWDTRLVELERTHREAKAHERDLETQIRDIDGRSQRLALDDMQERSAKESELRDKKRIIAAVEHSLRHQGLVIADYDGVILEINAAVGQTIGPGQKLGAIQAVDFGDTASRSTGLQGVAYFTVGDGKRIESGMKVQLTPATVKREEYGGITGRVTHVSAFSVSPESAADMVSSREVAGDLTREGRNIEVLVELDADPTNATGFRWSSSKGPDVRVTAGTTGAMRVVIEEKAPITLVLPPLQRFFSKR